MGLKDLIWGKKSSPEKIAVAAQAANPAPSVPAPAPKPVFEWSQSEAFQQRTYPTYEAYAEHQKSKLAKLDLSKYNLDFSQALQDRLREVIGGVKFRGSNVLCLGARTGAECDAFIKLGYFPIGIDLNPGEGNRYVVVGDFHDLQYADKTVDMVYTNALDHAFDLEKIVSEVIRVLKDDGIFIAEIVDPSVRGPGDYEAIWWKTLNDVIGRIESVGLTVWETQDFEYPWQGRQVIFVKNGDRRKLPITQESTA
ncbi:class I SAM-dependent methyltransferase [Rhizobium cremeum]|uniref:class I SAM-dependent methyltransferase n=1 Tax=Rhizobium cremeum TaxID=2813827 RepID=UPI0039DF829B